ncbi:MAG TPA: ABC transporter ATP-binding protein, partial [Candidatus Bathyarchaeota archaeon]|nr:ABC transporter ATP-binding protein [Candidatus Bathyarchaeota archaeon]HEX69246.1 ABC transporter ATP-binding protein [Candidatus Bathyarchaeota archaeon]
MVEVKGLKKYFPVRRGLLTSIFSRVQLYVRAVDGIDFNIEKRQIFGLVGESGSGKTTTGRTILKLIEPTDGKILFEGKDITRLTEKEFKPLRRKMQIIFQDPYESLNPKMTVLDIIAEPLRIQKVTAEEKETEERVFRALEDVQLVPPEEFLYRYPHELSGGQRQRVAVARALVLRPDFIVADEPVSMLDASIRAEVLNLLFDIKEKYGVSFLYITHDLALARHICDVIAVMYLGKIVEMAPVEKLVYEPLHPYTRALMAAVPSPDPAARRIKVVIKGEIPSPINPPSGCRFHTRCPECLGEICRKIEPLL